MNCKPGDLAIVVKGDPIVNIGKIIQVTKLLFPENSFFGAIWDYEGNLHEACDGVGDSCLLPIRDQPGQDETLTWAPVPHKVTA